MAGQTSRWFGSALPCNATIWPQPKARRFNFIQSAFGAVKKHFPET